MSCNVFQSGSFIKANKSDCKSQLSFYHFLIPGFGVSNRIAQSYWIQNCATWLLRKEHPTRLMKRLSIIMAWRSPFPKNYHCQNRNRKLREDYYVRICEHFCFKAHIVLDNVSFEFNIRNKIQVEVKCSPTQRTIDNPVGVTKLCFSTLEMIYNHFNSNSIISQQCGIIRAWGSSDNDVRYICCTRHLSRSTVSWQISYWFWVEVVLLHQASETLERKDDKNILLKTTSSSGCSTSPT